MYKLRKLLAKFLAGLSSELHDMSVRLEFGAIGHDDDYIAPPPPHSYATFKEGMSSTDYCTRHDAAAKLLGWYIHGGGHPTIEEITKAATVFLEDLNVTSGHVSQLVEIWVDQAIAATTEDFEKAEQAEKDLVTRLRKMTK